MVGERLSMFVGDSKFKSQLRQNVFTYLKKASYVQVSAACFKTYFVQKIHESSLKGIITCVLILLKLTEQSENNMDTKSIIYKDNSLM